MIRLFCVAVLICTISALAGCGEGYVVESARLNITDITGVSKGDLLATVTRVLSQEGFEDLGKYQQMIDLVQHGSMPEKEKAEELARLNRERTFLKDSSNLRVVWADYSAEVPNRLDVRYQPPSPHFIELSISESRPGGFSPAGFDFYRRFLAALREKYGSAVVVINEPPPTNDAEYRRITLKNRIAAIEASSIAMLVPLAVTGFLSVYGLNKIKISLLMRRLLFVLINTWLVAPMPFQGGFIFEFPGPNLLAFPWNDVEVYLRSASYAEISFPCTLVLCTVVSLVLFKRREASLQQAQ
jgi:hypothetical protein